MIETLHQVPETLNLRNANSARIKKSFYSNERDKWFNWLSFAIPMFRCSAPAFSS